LLAHILYEPIHKIGLDLVRGENIDAESRKLPSTYALVKNNLMVDFGEYGKHLPDVDIIIFDPRDSEILAVVSVKITLRERIAQTGYWKLKLSGSPATKQIRVYFVTPDEDDTFTASDNVRKGRAIVEVDTDGCYIMSLSKTEQSAKVKTFDRFVADMKAVIDQKYKGRSVDRSPSDSSLNGFFRN
jgi:type II restriction enzyme